VDVTLLPEELDDMENVYPQSMNSNFENTCRPQRNHGSHFLSLLELFRVWKSEGGREVMKPEDFSDVVALQSYVAFDYIIQTYPYCDYYY